jgi:hypothetical protein
MPLASPTTCPSGSANSAIVTSGSSVTGRIVFLLGFVEGRLRVVGADIERDVAVAIGRLPDAAADAAVLLLDHGVRHVTRDLLGLPAEELAVEGLE